MKLNQRGDTIVEVLISIAVVSLILSTAYALANRSSQAVRQSQERSEALQFSESQFEKLRAYLSSSKDAKWEADDLCIKDDGTKASISDAGLCSKGTDGRYSVKVTKNGDVYTSTSTWPRVNGNGDDVIKISYSIPSISIASGSPFTDGGAPEVVFNDDVDGDGLSGTTDPDDNDPCVPNACTPPTPPPNPTYVINGADYDACFVWSANANLYPCTKTGTSVYSCENYSVSYLPKKAKDSFPPGKYNLTISYEDNPCNSAFQPPPSSQYKYAIRVIIDGKDVWKGDVDPPSGTIHVNLGEIHKDSKIGVYWGNNHFVYQWFPYAVFDPDFQINSITLEKQ